MSMETARAEPDIRPGVGPGIGPGAGRDAASSGARAGLPTGFRIEPSVVEQYVEVLRGEALTLARLEAELGAAPVDDAWFGALPQTAPLADEVRRQRNAGLDALAGVAVSVSAAAEVLAGNVATYVEADALVAEAFGRVGGAARREG